MAFSLPKHQLILILNFAKIIVIQRMATKLYKKKPKLYYYQNEQKYVRLLCANKKLILQKFMFSV